MTLSRSLTSSLTSAGLTRPAGLVRVTASLLSEATAELGGVAPYHYWDFIANRALFAGADVGALASTPGWSFTRASTGYAETVAGTLTAFASGELRRTDKGVLIEGARTNLCLQSQTFDNASWNKTNVTVTANQIAAPDGTTTADLATENGANDEHYIGQQFTKAGSATTYTASIYCKSAQRNILIICRQTSASANHAKVGVNLSTGAIGLAAAAGGTFSSASATVSALADSWYRVTLTFTTSTETDLNVRLYLSDGAYAGAHQGDGTSGLYLWGAQLE